MPKAVENHSQNSRWSKQRLVETHIEAAWRGMGADIPPEEFFAMAQDAAAIISLRGRLEARIASGEIIPGKTKPDWMRP
jgi:hypothetical protein